jgi:hypothetical protein
VKGGRGVEIGSARGSTAPVNPRVKRIWGRRGGFRWRDGETRLEPRREQSLLEKSG